MYYFLYIHLMGFLISGFADSKIQFSKKNIKVGSISLNVEIADTPRKQEQGLMFRTSISEGSGMLFIYPHEKILNFWMKNTFVPLSIGFFNKDKKLIEYFDMKPVQSESQIDIPSYSSTSAGKYALEVPQGWFRKNKIKIGDKLVIE